MRSILAAAVMAFAAPLSAACPEGMEFLFACDIVERGARVEMCAGGGLTQYTYAVDGVPELEFVGPTWGGSKARVAGIHGHAYASATRSGNLFYAAFVDRDLMGIDAGGGSLNSPNPAVVQVYDSEEAFTDFEADAPIARRVCFPPTIELGDNNFGPG